MIKRLKSGLVFLSVSVLLLLSSCVMMKAEGEQLRSDISRLKNEITTLQRDKSDFAIVMGRKYEQVQARVTALENTTYRKASDESELSGQLRKEVEDLRGQLEEAQKNIETIAEPSKMKSAEVEAAPADKSEHFSWAQDAYDEKKYESAFIRIESFIEKYKDDKKLGDQAYILKGDSALMLAKSAQADAAKKDFYKKAVTSYQDLLTRFPKSHLIPEGLFKVGETLQAMGFEKDAKIFFEEITTKHAKSPFAKKAVQSLKSLSKKKKK